MAKVIIVGGGPAGLSASIYTARAGIETLVISSQGGSLERADKIENYFGFAAPVSGSELLHSGHDQAERLGVQFVASEVVGVGYAGKGFNVKIADGGFDAGAVVLATGSSRAAPKLDGLSALEGHGVSFCAVCDGFFFRGKRVAVLGSGEYAKNELEELKNIAGSLTLLTNGDAAPGGLPESARVVTTPIAALKGGGKLEAVALENGDSLELDGLFIAMGTAGSADLARKLGVALNGASIVVNADMSTNVPGVFAAGDCVGGILQVATAVHEGAAAGLAVSRYLRSK